MELSAGADRRNNKTIYNYCSAKKVIFRRTQNNELLIEELNSPFSVRAVSLLERGATIRNIKNRVVVYFETNI